MDRHNGLDTTRKLDDRKIFRFKVQIIFLSQNLPVDPRVSETIVRIFRIEVGIGQAYVQ